MRIDVIDPNTGKVIDIKDRRIVHTSGLWHNSVQANIIRLNNNILEILIQKRSRIVDIAKNCYDQSCATQAKAGERNMLKVMLRGLKEELGIDEKKCKYFEFNVNGEFRIKKTYDGYPLLKNNEILHLFIVNYLGKEIEPKSKKVSFIKWIPWSEFVKLSRGKNYTKTVKMYTQNKQVRESLEKAMYNFLKFGDPKNKDIFNLELHSFNENRFYNI